MIENATALDDLVVAMLIDDDNPRRSQDGADALQTTAVLALTNLALSEVARPALRAHTEVMTGLRAIAANGGDRALSEEARRHASAALFELDELARNRSREALVDSANEASAKQTRDSNVKPVMLSYNWDFQEVIKRINAALKRQRYNVWIDIEKMQGSTVEIMADAVENCAVMCYGVCKAYKESTNCRMEAQYAHQQKIDMVPLMVEAGYSANGWLGMVLGMRLWYGFYGTTLASEGAFEAKENELCRELGERGKV